MQAMGKENKMERVIREDIFQEEIMASWNLMGARNTYMNGEDDPMGLHDCVSWMGGRFLLA